MKVRLISATKIEQEFLDSFFVDDDGFKEVLEQPEGLMCYIARVSSPNQENPKYARLLKYCIEHSHWSPFEMCDMTVEIETSRAIAQQILRHRSFCFQEFSQRYAPVSDDSVEIYEARRQDLKNRQNSTDDMNHSDKKWFQTAQRDIWNLTHTTYNEALKRGIAKECARNVLPLNTKTKIYMKGTVRSWIHYIDLRAANGTQKEHMDIALAIKDIFVKKFPVIAEAKGWQEKPKKTSSDDLPEATFGL